jgi:inhibitor of cysteine peptidase
MRKNNAAFALLLAVTPLAASFVSSADERSYGNESHEKEVAEFRAEVVFVSLEGGFWGLKGEDGRHYDPGGLASEFRQPGLMVHVRAKRASERVSFRMWGTPIEIVHIQRAAPDSRQ